ncbi:MAG TPA: hypothetical protein VH163_06155 [Gemmatimonadales bacterium]|nr:hypothetical protein [Gemmatimonadales bacterium]
MLPLILLATTLGRCDLFQPVKCDSAVVELGATARAGFTPEYRLVAHQNGYLLVLRVQGDHVDALYPAAPAIQHPIQAGDTLVVDDESWSFTNRTPGFGLLFLWSPRPIDLNTYRAGAAWSPAALTARWQALVAQEPARTMMDHLGALARDLADPLITAVHVEALRSGRERGPGINLPPSFWNPYSQPGTSDPVASYRATHPSAPIPGVPFGPNSCAGQIYAVYGSSGMGTGC